MQRNDCLRGSHWRHAFRKRSMTLRRLKPNVLRFRRHNVLEHFRNSCNAIWTCSMRQKPVLYVGKLSILKKLTWVTFFKTHRLPSSSGAQCTVARKFGWHAQHELQRWCWACHPKFLATVMFHSHKKTLSVPAVKNISAVYATNGRNTGSGLQACSWKAGSYVWRTELDYQMILKIWAFRITWYSSSSSKAMYLESH